MCIVKSFPDHFLEKTTEIRLAVLKSKQRENLHKPFFTGNLGQVPFS